MAEESIAGGGSKQEMKRIKRKQRHLQSSQGLKKNSGRDIIQSGWIYWERFQNSKKT